MKKKTTTIILEPKFGKAIEINTEESILKLADQELGCPSLIEYNDSTNHLKLMYKNSPIYIDSDETKVYENFIIEFNNINLSEFTLDENFVNSLYENIDIMAKPDKDGLFFTMYLLEEQIEGSGEEIG